MNRYRALLPLVPLALASCADPATSPFFSVDASVDRRGEPTLVRDLGTLGGAQSFAWDINDDGIVVGASETSDGSLHAFRWTEAGGMEDLGTLGGSTSSAVAINRRGFIAGTSTDAAGVTHLVMWLPSGAIRDRGVPPGDPASGLYPLDINERNEIVGDYYPPSDDNQVFHWMEHLGIAFYPWHPGEAYAGGTNKHGDVAGKFCCGLAPYYGIFFAERGVGFRDVASVESYNASAAAINDHRVIVGWDEDDPAVPPSTYWTAPFRWTPTGGFEILGSLGGDDGYATDVNNRGEIVGHSGLEVGEVIGHAFFWTAEHGMVDLGPGRPSAINNHAVIVGVLGGTLGGPPMPRATMWTGTGGLASTHRASLRRGSQRVDAEEDCFAARETGPSKSMLLRCLKVAGGG